jgi:glucose/arabinose dehydrogenase
LWKDLVMPVPASVMTAAMRLTLLVGLLASSLASVPVAAEEPTLAAQAEQSAPWITVPPGFAATLVARLPEYKQPTAIAYGPDGALYIAVLAGEIYRLDDGGALSVFAGPFLFPLGLAWRGDELYLSALSRRGRVSQGDRCSLEDPPSQIVVLRDADGDRKADAPRVLLPNLPVGHGSRHFVNNIAFGLDGKLYVTNGSCNNATRTDDDPRRGTIQRYNPDGTIPDDNPTPGSPVIATGIRNPYGVAVHPVDGAVFFSENGRDDLGDDLPPDEINHVIFGPGQSIRNYGWPDCYGAGGGQNCEGTQPPVVATEPHPSANGMDFYTADQFGPEYKHNLFVAYYGAGDPGNRPWGKKVQRLELTRSGETYTARSTTFAVGFERPLAVLTARNGGLLVADFGAIGETGAIYRIDRRPDANPFARVPAPTGENAPAYVEATGHTVAPDFLRFWEKYGGLAMFGYPISQEFMEDGVVVQYFERARFERAIGERCQRPLKLEDEQCQEFRVRLGLLGRTLAAGRENEPAFARTEAFPDTDDRRYFPETGHSLGGPFKRYWDGHGGARVLGLPISEEFAERNPDTGQEYTVQYFERARFEYHPEHAGTDAEVLLGRLGAQIAGQRYP